MRFTVLGSGTTVPDPERGPAGFLVRAGGGAWLVDGGSGTLQRCARAGVDPRRLDGGVYSHRHPDHCGDLVSLLFSMHAPPTRTTDYPIWAGEGFAAMLDGLRAIYGHWLALDGAVVRVNELSIEHPTRSELGPVALLTRPARHSGGALHLRFEGDGRAVVFSGDTAASRALVELARDADLLVCECGGSDEQPIRGHLRPTEIAALVDEARPREVWLTHLYPHVDAALAVATVARTGVRVRRADDLDTWGEE